MSDKLKEAVLKIFEKDYKGKIIRIFVSYSTEDKLIAGKIKDVLEKYGLSVFLAHEDIKPTADWKEEIIHNLRGCDIFLPILTANFRQSEWTDQETGMAIALDKLVIPLNVDRIPYGFVGKYQALKFDNNNVEISCMKIIKIIEEKPVFKEALKDCFIRSLEKVNNFHEANDVLEMLSRFNNFTKEQINQIIRNSICNNQVRLCSKGKSLIPKLLSEYTSFVDPLLKEKFIEVKDKFGLPSEWFEP